MNSNMNSTMNSTLTSKSSTSATVCCFIGCLIGLVLLTVCIGAGYFRHLDKTRPEMSLETNETFLVQNNQNEPEWIGKEVAKRIGRLAVKADQVVAYLEQHKRPDPVVSERLAKRWNKLRSKKNGLRETGKNETSAAYTVNKGEELRICVRDKKTGSVLEEENTGFFVLLHELAHLMSKEYGHNLEFQNNFAYITKIAIQLGLYRNVDYSQNPTSYCNTEITHSP